MLSFTQYLTPGLYFLLFFLGLFLNFYQIHSFSAHYFFIKSKNYTQAGIYFGN